MFIDKIKWKLGYINDDLQEEKINWEFGVKSQIVRIHMETGMKRKYIDYRKNHSIKCLQQHIEKLK